MERCGLDTIEGARAIYAELNNQRRKQKQFGVYYTPTSLAEQLAEWGIRSGHELVLEPSAGGGALVEAALRRLAKMSAHSEDRGRVYACDIDAEAIVSLRQRLGAAVNYLTGDFLSLKPEEHPRFDVIIANPPFTRNHAIAPVMRAELRSRFAIRGSAGLWVHFLLHSSQFLRERGRMVSLIPAVSVSTVYGQELVRRLRETFASVEVQPLESRPTWHVAAEERGAILRAEGYLQSADNHLRHVKALQGGHTSRRVDSSNFRHLTERSRPLGELAKLSIGAVTGRNRVFLLSEEERERAGISLSDVRPIVSRAHHLAGLTVSARDIESVAKAGGKTWLLQPSQLSAPVIRHLAQIEEHERSSVAWFRKRQPWWKVETGEFAHGFFTYMNHLAPRIVLSRGDLACTNTLHKVVFTKEVSTEQRQWCALSLISTFGQLASESVGRVYGGGVLKFELVDARKLPVLVLDGKPPEGVLDRADNLLRRGELTAARELADDAILPRLLGARSTEAQRCMFAALTALRVERLGEAGASS